MCVRARVFTRVLVGRISADIHVDVDRSAAPTEGAAWNDVMTDRYSRRINGPRRGNE